MKLFLTFIILLASVVLATMALYADEQRLPLALLAMLACIVGTWLATRRNKTVLYRTYIVDGKQVMEPLERPKKK